MQQISPQSNTQSSSSLESAVSRSAQLVIRQKKELGEIVLGFETKNRYEIFGTDGVVVGHATEQAKGFLALLKRWFLGSHRGFRFEVTGVGGEVALNFSRRAFLLFSDIFVFAKDGKPLGSVHRRFGILYKRYDLRLPDSSTFARMRSPIWRLWTFPILDLQNNERARIQKRWGGALREIFTDADTFLVDFGNHGWKTHERAVILAAALSVDFDFFENNTKRSG